MDTALRQKFPFILNRNLANAKVYLSSMTTFSTLRTSVVEVNPHNRTFHLISKQYYLLPILGFQAS